MEAILRQ